LPCYFCKSPSCQDGRLTSHSNRDSRANLFDAIDYGLYLELFGKGTSLKVKTFLMEPQQRVDIVAYLFRTVGASAILPCIAGMAAGIYQQHDTRPVHIYYALLGGIAAVVAILGLTAFSGRQWVLTEYLRGFSDPQTAFYGFGTRRWSTVDKNMKRLAAVVDIMLLVVSILTTAWVWVAVTTARKAGGGWNMLDRVSAPRYSTVYSQ